LCHQFVIPSAARNLLSACSNGEAILRKNSAAAYFDFALLRESFAFFAVKGF
jgi:hypothetical protein